MAVTEAVAELLDRLGVATPASRLQAVQAALGLAAALYVFYRILRSIAIVWRRKHILGPMPKAPGWVPLVSE